MILLNPWALLFALAIGVILLLHLRRPKLARRVSNLQLWQLPAGEAAQRRPILERIRRSWLLILQVLFLVFVVLALTRPSFLIWENPRLIVMVMDSSASMNAKEGVRSRLDLAREKAIGLLDQVRRMDRVLLVQSRPQPVSKMYPGSDIDAISRALLNLSGTEAAADLGKALVMAIAASREEGSCEIFVFSDFAQKISLPAQNAKLHFIQVGASGNNVAITLLSVRNNPFSPYDQEVFAEIANFSEKRKELRFEMSFEGANLIREDVTLASGERKSFAVKPPPAGRGIVEARIVVKDDLDADNKAYAVLDPKKTKVLLITEGNRFLEKALAVFPQILCTVKTPREWSEELQKEYDLIILDGFEPRPLPPANYFILKHAGDNRLYDARNLSSTLPDHPVMTHVKLENVVVEEAVPVQTSSSAALLIHAGGKPLLAASESDAFRTVTLGFDIHSSNLPLTLSFPVLVSNIVNWLSPGTGDPGNQIAAGELLRRRVPVKERAGEVSITDPRGVVGRASYINGILTFQGTENTGIYSIRDGDLTDRFAVNLLNDRESDIKPLRAMPGSSKNLAEAAALSRAGREVWRALLMIALALLLLEWLYYYLFSAPRRESVRRLESLGASMTNRKSRDTSSI